MEGAFKNIIDWIHSNLHVDLIKYTTDSQVHASNNVLQVMNELMKQEVKSDGIQYFKINHESIILDLFTESNIYDNDSYASYVDWKIEKTPEANSKKLEFNIDKTETNLKKIDLNINVNDNEINNMINQEAVHPSGDITNDNNNNIEDHETQQERIKQNNGFLFLLKTNYNRALS